MKSSDKAAEEIAISVIMPVYNGSDYIVKSLPPLLAMQQQGEVMEVIVVDDSSTDDSAGLAAKMGARVISSGGRLGPGAARNKAATAVKGNIIWFVDADVIVHGDAVRFIHEGFVDSGVVAIFGSYDDSPPAGNFLSQYKNLVHHFYHHRGRREASTFWSGCGAVRKDAFLTAGGFDVERFTRPSIEDIELGYRLRAAGGRILLIPELQSTHLKVWRFLNLIHTEVFCRAIPWSRLIFEQPEMAGDLNVSPAERMRAVLAGLFLMVLLAAVFGLLPLWSVLLAITGVTLANLELAKLFVRMKGPLFALLGILFHQIYYLYSSAAFVYAWLEWKISGPHNIESGRG
ncbi:MAG TPA: glycosyltransferase [Gammaproteobacteria bacterium]|nr:glycosyltransferase [Gammaproteobacteria bacterium]